jgi:opacity protein-like surface antigen
VPIGCRIEVDVTTTNSVLYGGLGPEVVLATGAVEPYVNASLGFSYFATTSSLSGQSDSEDFASTTNFDDALFAWRAGAGVRVQVHGGRNPVALDLGLERHENGVADFLAKGDIQDNPDGSITVFPNRSEANMVTVRLGVTVGLPHRARNR